MKNKICSDCEKRFPVLRGSMQKYCPDCREQRLSYTNKNCIVCNKEYKSYQTQQKYCSVGCREQYWKSRQGGQSISFKVFERDNFRCAYCGKTSYEDDVKLVVEHIFPRSKGGTNDSHNTITACLDCNSRKGNKIMDWNIIISLWQEVEKRNKKNDIEWSEIKKEFDKIYEHN